ncbi:hypothetical protein ACFO9E_22195 [Streptomyces maoxianensis]|uniref:Uncharacterized protein n=1 Tax=Streptomyces maoxianensis TaxID=1459942 RepID=A0ABV9G8A1_9ACTN
MVGAANGGAASTSTDRCPPPAKEQGWLGEIATIEASLAATEQKTTVMRDVAARHTTVHLGMPDFRSSAGRLDPEL